MIKVSRYFSILTGLFLVNLGYAQDSRFFVQLAQAAFERTQAQVVYDPTYFSIDYPNGDVPADKGVCTDVVIRSYRALSIDLQKLVHEDMRVNFLEYPNLWGLDRPDRNIDHRRVPNLRTFFTRKGASIPVSDSASEYSPGDLVTWDLGSGLKHIGMVTSKKARNGNPLIVHNIGRGPQLEDILFDFKITGHYRYKPQ
ncbi:MAG: DUF1287 domain-containing protein [Cyclobacteriaceae bacterium]|nr:DUF1287 domain-containing protein [Cyclobacteriaceae bacterium]